MEPLAKNFVSVIDLLIEKYLCCLCTVHQGARWGWMRETKFTGWHGNRDSKGTEARWKCGLISLQLSVIGCFFSSFFSHRITSSRFSKDCTLRFRRNTVEKTFKSLHVHLWSRYSSVGLAQPLGVLDILNNDAPASKSASSQLQERYI